MKSRILKLSIPALLFGLLLSAAAPALADPYHPFSGDPNFSGGVICGPDGCPVIIPPDLIYFQRVPYETRFEQRQREWFHPGYESWREYYANPPWRHEYDLRRNFHPWWMQ